ncbi:MAG: elongation factor G [Gammaproteobacteria bacterium]|nr:elongation factor G [Gammaproteobacteria bacterium]
MSRYSTQDIRNVALVGHAGSGKTTLVEALLHACGAISALGSVDRGDTVSDFDELEQKHQHSLRASLVNLDHGRTHINLFDTPGYPDFMGQALGVLPAVETMAVVINAQNGIETMSRRFMDWAAENNLCRMVIVNKIDAEDVNLRAVLDSIRETFGKECLAINLPAANTTKVVDCFFNPAGESDFSSVADAHTAVIDQTVEVDEELMAAYLDQGEVAPAQLHDAFETALREGHLVPVCFVSAKAGIGVTELLDVLAKLMPNPTEGNPPPFVRDGDEEPQPIEIQPDPDGHILAHVFQVTFDPYVGKLGIFRIHQGSVTKDSELYVNNGRKAFKVSHLFKLQGKRHEEIDAGIPGDICAVAKVVDLHFDSMLHNFHEEDDVRLQKGEFPMPLAGLAVNAKKRGDEQKMSEALEKLAEEDPCISVSRDPSTHETVLRGLGELHLRTALERMEEVHHVGVDTKPPTVPYRETITRKADGHHRHKKQTGGAGQFGEVYLDVEPVKRGCGFEFVNRVVGGVIPSQFIPSVEKGVRQVLERGAIAGYPMQDVRVSVYDGKFHSVDSNEVSFITAGRKAFIDAIEKANPIILEPIVDIEVTIPNDSMGDIAGDLSSRRGRVQNTDMLGGGMVTIRGQVPLAELSDYQSRLKSMTGGEGSYTMRLSHYHPTPATVQKELVVQHQKQED